MAPRGGATVAWLVLELLVLRASGSIPFSSSTGSITTITTTTLQSADVSCPNLAPPSNGSVQCRITVDEKVCSPACRTGFVLDPNAAATRYTCRTAEGVWYPSDTFPSCLPLCFGSLDGCQNGGTCVWPDTCRCARGFEGSQCEKAALCQAPSSPLGGRSSCLDDGGDFLICTLACDGGTRLASSRVYVCDHATGAWTPQLPGDASAFPDCLNTTDSCEQPLAPLNGQMACNVSADGLQQCFPTCDASYSFAEGYYVAPVYSCVSGQWYPPGGIPDCVLSASAIVPSGTGFWSGVFESASVPPYMTGYCTSWGQHHYRTFDGRIFRFDGRCSFLLAGDCTDNTFQIVVHNDRDCPAGGAPCDRALSIHVGLLSFELRRQPNGVPSVMSNGEVVALPSTIYGFVFQQSSSYIMVRSSLGFDLKWDGSEAIYLKVGEEMYGKTCGLCGKFDRDQADDFSTRHGLTLQSVITFANAWIEPFVGEVCMAGRETNYCGFSSCNAGLSVQSAELARSAVNHCLYLLNTPCQEVVDSIPYYDACLDDVCACSGNQPCACASMAAYFQECTRFGVYIDWRATDRCPMVCPADMVYDMCGSACPRTCFDTVYDCEDDHCVDGCHCPNGTFLYDGACVVRESCPCLLMRTEYQPGSRVTQDCNECVCMYGIWHCTQNICDAVCSVTGGGHYLTFDGRTYDFFGDCTYTAVRNLAPDDLAFNIDVEYYQCSSGAKRLNAVHVTAGDKTVTLAQDLIITATDYPNYLPFRSGSIYVESVTQQFQKVTLDNGVFVLWDGRSTLYITAPSVMMGRVLGLCGTFNRVQMDDFLTPEGDIESNSVNFGNRWKALASCANVGIEPYSHPCDLNSQSRAYAHSQCGKILLAPFTKCHEAVSYAAHYESCLVEVCSDLMKPVQRMCDAFSTYSFLCAKAGVLLDSWRSSIPECAVTCPADKVFSECAPACQASCGSLADPSLANCTEQCVEGCTCPAGLVQDYSGFCVPPEECPCVWRGEVFPAGDARFQDCNVCECHLGQWVCTENDCSANMTCGPNQEFVSCLDPNVVTCDNMHLPRKVYPVERCYSGCQCANGTVWDTYNRLCVLPEHCPCYHGGKSYNEGETMSIDCNTCMCLSQQWQCESKECAAVCSAYGASHVTTFDWAPLPLPGLVRVRAGARRRRRGHRRRARVERHHRERALRLDGNHLHQGHHLPCHRLARQGLVPAHGARATNHDGARLPLWRPLRGTLGVRGHATGRRAVVGQGHQPEAARGAPVEGHG
ncbi:von Willebrand factor-like [Lethenteron reissneri]|uniref:von Willebrand factor-like n=1 Tax=Lethenteron reissneri TaxID=7753 RepID=UPI002AB68461|nr:von Willebrand factor-like [Lethenteron reissneri]